MRQREIEQQSENGGEGELLIDERSERERRDSERIAEVN